MTIDPGKTGEYLFAAEVLRRNLVPCWPSTQMGAVDIVVLNAARALRVQVKATQKSGATIQVTSKMSDGGRDRRYKASDVDLIAVYIFSLQVWYIIPVRKIRSMAISLHPEDPRCPYAKYKEAWSLLEQM